MRPVLYSFRRCPYAMRARMALIVAGIEVELREVLLRHKPAEMLEASPKGTVPVMVLENGDVLEESFDIMLWALATHDPENWLRGERSAERRDILELARGVETDFKPHLDRYKYPNRYTDEPILRIMRCQ
ncbi:MAG: glutathione S-transferase N-terminal domain-containing protein, partial [Pseudomonadota bacterium]